MNDNVIHNLLNMFLVIVIYSGIDIFIHLLRTHARHLAADILIGPVWIPLLQQIRQQLTSDFRIGNRILKIYVESQYVPVSYRLTNGICMNQIAECGMRHITLKRRSTRVPNPCRPRESLFDTLEHLSVRGTMCLIHDEHEIHIRCFE